MSEQKPEKKVVSRTVPIVIGIICIVLGVGLVGAIAEITSLNSTIATQKSQIEQFDFDSQNCLPSRSMIWVNNETVSQPANSYTNWNFSTNYAGFVVVYEQSLTSSIYLEAIWSYYGLHYDSGQVDLGTGPGQLSWNILPFSSIQIRIGNNNSFNNSTEAVTITYYY